MKREIIFFCLLFLLMGCTEISTQPTLTKTPTFAITATDTPSITPTTTSGTPVITRTPISTHVFQDDSSAINALKTSQSCPNFCWLGIHPGTTSLGNAVGLLKTSKHIQNMELFSYGIEAIWLPDDNGELKARVRLGISNGIIQLISLNSPYSPYLDSSDFSTSPFFTVGDLMSVLGEPNSLKTNRDCQRIRIQESCTKYILYYSIFQTALYTIPKYTNGPSPDDIIIKIESGGPMEGHQYLQPWLGYEHLEYYLKNPEPTLTPTPYP